jgi:hypothetical protein
MPCARIFYYENNPVVCRNPSAMINDRRSTNTPCGEADAFELLARVGGSARCEILILQINL